VTVTAKKSQYADKSISANFIATVIKNTSTNWATINSLSNGLNQKNYCIGRGSTFSNESYALSASCSGFMTNTTITYSVPYNPNNAVILSGNAVKPNPNCNVKGAKDYTVQVTLSNPNYTNTITKDFYFTIRYGAKFVTNLTSNEGGP
jgi:hypothetical protein